VRLRFRGEFTRFENVEAEAPRTHAPPERYYGADEDEGDAA
jgi:hypothetical protein